MSDAAHRYWAAADAHDQDAMQAIVRDVVASLRAKADEAERLGDRLGGISFRLNATAIERGDLPPYPRPVSDE